MSDRTRHGRVEAHRASWRSTRHDQRGAVAIVVAVSLSALVSLAALVLDGGAALVSKHQLQNLADAAALAGARQLGKLYESQPAAISPPQPLSLANRARVQAVVAEVAEKNRAATKLAAVTLSDVRVGRWNAATRTVVSTSTGFDAVLVRAEGSMPTFLAGVVGIRRLSVSATAVSALSALAEVQPGALTLPVGLSSAWMALGPIDGRRIQLYAPGGGDPCAAWTTFTDTPPTMGRLQAIVQALTENRYSSPATVAGKTGFQFVAGNPSTIAPDVMGLYNAKKNPATGQWTTVVPVYRQVQCAAPSGPLPVVGFATVIITSVATPSGPALDAVVRSGFVQLGRGGGTDYGTEGSLPGLVQ